MPFLTTLKDKFQIQTQKSEALLKITNSINQNFKTKELLAQFEDVMKNYVGIGRLALINHNNNWNCILNYGIGNDKCGKIDYSSITQFSEIAYINELGIEGFEQFEILIPVFHKETPLSYLLIGDLGVKEVNKFKEKHITFVQTITNIISVAIENKQISNKLMEKQLEEKDMKMAAEMQKLLLPSNLPTNHLIDISATYIAKQMVSGDYYDFIRINDEEYVFCIADVSGKGMPAAMLMSNFQATLRANVKYNHHNLTLEELIIELNQSVLNAANGEKYITFFIGYYNEKNRILKYINAGHNYPILYQNNQIHELKTGCTALGIFEKLPTIELQEINIETNTIIVCYTDGLVEAENKKGEQYQTTKLAQSIVNNSYLNMEQLNLALIREIYDFAGNDELPDDAAMLSLRII